MEWIAVNCNETIPNGVLGSSREIRSPDSGAESLDEWEDAVRAVFNGVYDAVLVHDDHGKVSYVNDNMLNLYGHPFQDLARLRAADRYYGHDAGAVSLAEIWQGVLAGQEKRFESKAARADNGAVFDAEVFLRKISLKGKDYILATVRDISDRKRMERELENALVQSSILRKEAEAASAAKSEFLTGMSHELRTPLNAIIGFSELLSDQGFGDLNDSQLGFAGQIFNSGHHLLSLINDILDLAKVEAGKVELRYSRVKLGGLLNGCLAMIKEKAY
ncbi:MAG: histidine kinase dimerization/phospho-acceptor domain-containing protein, partial [Pseudomonadota bacterium]